MEFEELQKIWDTQNNQLLFAIDENALHKRIVSKKYQLLHIARFSEWLTMIVNAAAGGFTLWHNFIKQGTIILYILAAWLFGCALYGLINRIRRINAQQRFDRSVLGDLKQAITTASYQVRLSLIMRWNILAIGLLILVSFWETGKSGWIILGVFLFFMLVFYASGWEHNIYKTKKQELEVLLKKLQEE